MDLQNITSKRAADIEQQITSLLKTMRSAKLTELPVYKSLQELEQELGNQRRNRFDDTTSDYAGY